MNRFGRPLAAAMCQPSDVIRFCGAVPTTLVEMQLLNPTFAFRMSQTPQKQTYAASPWTAIAYLEWAGSAAASVARGEAFAWCGCSRVPRSKPFVQQLSVHWPAVS